MKRKSKFELAILIALTVFGIFVVGVRIGYNKAIHDAQLMAYNGNHYVIGYGDNQHGWNCHEYTTEVGENK